MNGLLYPLIWLKDTHISDLANDDNFTTDWIPLEKIKEVYLETDLTKETAVNANGFVESTYPNNDDTKVGKYAISYYSDRKWNTLDIVIDNSSIARIHRFPTVKMEKGIYFTDSQSRLYWFIMINRKSYCRDYMAGLFIVLDWYVMAVVSLESFT